MTKQENNQFLQKYWGRALASRVLFAWIPWLRYVGLNGSLARGEASSSSDIDMMVIAAPGHIYTVRFLMLAIITLVGIKRDQSNIAGRLCVNCFQTSDNLDIRPHNKKVARSHRYMISLIDTDQKISNLKSQSPKLQCESQKKRFSRRPPKRRTPQNDRDMYQSQIFKENQWMGKYKIPISEHQLQFNKQIRPLGGPWNIIRRLLEIALWPVGSITEKILKYIQLQKIARHPLTAANRDRIITTDKELMFHPKKDADLCGWKNTRR